MAWLTEKSSPPLVLTSVFLVWDPAVISTALSPVHTSACWVLREFLCFICCAFPSDNVMNVFSFFHFHLPVISRSVFWDTLFWRLESNSGSKWVSCFLAWAEKVALVLSWWVWWTQKYNFSFGSQTIWLRSKLFGDVALFFFLFFICRPVGLLQVHAYPNSFERLGLAQPLLPHSVKCFSADLILWAMEGVGDSRHVTFHSHYSYTF